jgi:hypothetical protein
MLGPGLELAPALPVQGTIDNRVMDRIAESLRLALLHGSGDDDFPLLGPL